MPPSLLNPPWHEALSFTDDVRAVLSDKDYAEFCQVLDRANNSSQFSDEDLELVVSFLKGHKHLPLRFNMFLLDGEIAYYRDENGQEQVMGIYTDDSMVYDYKAGKELPSPTEKPVAVARLFGAACHQWNEDEKALVTAVVGGEKTAIEDLDRAFEIVSKDKSDQEAEQLALLLGKTLPDGPNKCIIGVWSKMPDLVEKKIALWAPDSPHGWTFYALENATDENATDSRKRKAVQMPKVESGA